MKGCPNWQALGSGMDKNPLQHDNVQGEYDEVLFATV